MKDAHIAFMHPTNSYLRFIKYQAANDFERLREEANGDEAIYKFLRRKECKKIRKRMRINSQLHSYRSSKMYMEIKPKTRRDLQQIIDLMFSTRIVDMGNACYVHKHYSDVI